MTGYVAHPWDVLASQIAAGAQTIDEAEDKATEDMRADIESLESDVSDLRSSIDDIEEQISDLWEQLEKRGVKRHKA